MKLQYVFPILLLCICTSCIKSLPPLAENEEEKGEIFTIFNETGRAHLPFCGEGRDLTFEFSSNNEFDSFNILAGNSVEVAFKIEPGEYLRVKVKDTETGTEYITQRQLINSDINKTKTIVSLPLQTIRACPQDILEFINF